jgi:hypothetical protein
MRGKRMRYHVIDEGPLSERHRHHLHLEIRPQASRLSFILRGLYFSPLPNEPARPFASADGRLCPA